MCHSAHPRVSARRVMLSVADTYEGSCPQSGDQQLSCCPSSQLRLRVLPYPPQASRASLVEVMAPRKGAAQVAKKPAVAELPPFEECNVSKTMIEPWQKVASASSADERAAAIDAAVSMLQSEGPASIVAYKVVKRVKYSAVDLNATAREGAMLFISALVEKMGRTCEPFLIELLPAVLVLYSDKLQNVRAAADAAGRAICSTICPFAAKLLLPAIFEGMSDRKNWRTAEGALVLLSVLANSAPRQLARCLPEIVPKVSEAMSDSKEQVRKAAYDAMTDACAAIGNRDIEQFIPVLVSSIARPIEVPETVHKLSATTFVQAVTAPTLSIMVPLLSRGLRDRAPAIKRKSAIITENMSKLIDDPLAAVPFLPKLLPGLELVSKDAADPEIRTVASKAHKTLSVVGEEAQVIMANLLNDKEQVEMVLTVLKSTLAEIAPIVVDDGVVATLDYVSAMCAVQMILKNFDEEDWQKMIVPSLKAFVSEEDAEKVAAKVLQLCMADYESRKVKQYEEEDDEGEELCTCEFSLAYGGKILLNNAGLFLKRGRRYGLCGPNGCGKSTLMRAIANGQLDGFPSPDELKTVYVEHDLDASVAEVAVVDLIMNEPALVGIEREHVVETLASVGFTPEWQASPVAALSGGWKMKLALARAMLMKADILLLDEPTNHLDVKNVQWLCDYLTGLKDVSCIIVSHDSGFLDNVCTDIIHYENRKLKQYRGNLSKFVEQKPEAKVYYELAEATIKFTFPEPGFLEGVKTKDKAILKMTRVSFQYPGATKIAVADVTVQCSLSSRVAVIGPNGAGKSTLIKLLTGELEATNGTCWKHPNLRVAYVAQHAFHHVEQHLDMTPNEYIRWRYAFGEDREEQDKVSRKIKEDEEKKMAEKVVIDGTKRIVDCLLSRRKLKKGYEYEVQWKGGVETTWLPRATLEEMGFVKLVNEIDAKEAAAQGLITRPLTIAMVQKHLEEFGLESEFGTHSRIRGLSGGQKVKLVLAGAMWNCPHMLVLDEPTNYLDRDSLGALANAIKEYGGGVVMISHNSEFTSALCPEVWRVEAGLLTPEGAPAWLNNAKLELKKQADEMIDAFGNTVKVVQQKKQLSRKELKAKEKARKARIAAAEGSGNNASVGIGGEVRMAEPLGGEGEDGGEGDAVESEGAVESGGVGGKRSGRGGGDEAGAGGGGRDGGGEGGKGGGVGGGEGGGGGGGGGEGGETGGGEGGEGGGGGGGEGGEGGGDGGGKGGGVGGLDGGDGGGEGGGEGGRGGDGGGWGGGGDGSVRMLFSSL
ncbi:unnamed protein product [Closterium sp. Naga37s-1]|nr:unnamed protein product [Closterium sp. Naga37s-1]